MLGDNEDDGFLSGRQLLYIEWLEVVARIATSH